MGKISPVSAKYIIHAYIEIEGVVDKPDVIGAIFGQTEGLLGSDLELRELQRSGRIGRIEVNTETKGGKTKGAIIIPSSLDKAETAIIAAALEIIQRIGPCNAKMKVENIEDVRISKRKFVIERAKELLKELMDKVLPDSQEIADEVAYSVRVMEVQEYGKERLPAGPAIDESDEVIVVEGRADVLNLLKHGIKNAIALNGTSVPATIKELSKKKVITAFVDGDRGGDLILKELFDTSEIDFVTKAPDGKEVEEITKKEIHKALRSKISAEQAKLELGVNSEEDATQAKKHQQGSQKQNAQGAPSYQAQQGAKENKEHREQHQPYTKENTKEFQRETKDQSYANANRRAPTPPPIAKAPLPRQELTAEQKEKFGEMLEDLIGTKAAYLINANMQILGKVPTSELLPTLKNVTGVYSIVIDGELDKELIKESEKANVKVLVGMETTVNKRDTPITLLTVDDL
ncbi:MAG: DNA primase DnaG [Candidatus Woesearchaeota archaeon]